MSEGLDVATRAALGTVLVCDVALRTCFGRLGRARRRPVRERLSGTFTPLGVLMVAVGAGYYLGLVLFVVRPGLFAFGQLATSAAALAAGTVVLAAGLALLVWSHVTLGRAFGFDLEPVAGQPLVTDGPYRHIRHPMYAAVALMSLGAAAATANLFFAGVAVLTVVGVNLRARREDRALEAVHGETWRRYAATCGRFLPKKLC